MAELAPETLLRATTSCLRDTLAVYAGWRKTRRGPIVAVGTSCFWHSFLGADAKGRALTPVYTWGDSRAATAADRLRRRLDVRDIHRRTGCMIHSSYWPAKLVWLRSEAPSCFGAVRYWLSPAEWIYWRVLGLRRCAHGMATGTGLYDPNREDWDRELMTACGIVPDQVFEIGDEPGMPQGRRGRSGALSNALGGALSGAVWFPAVGDGLASNLGSGALDAQTAAINLGSSAAVRVVRSARRVSAPFGLFAYRLRADAHLVGGAISNAGNLRAWCLRELRLPNREASVERALGARMAPDHGLTVLPFWHAERAPTWRDDLRGAVVGFRPSTTAMDVLQAVIEAGYHRLAEIMERIPTRGAALQTIVSGGLSRSAAGLVRLANVLGRDILASREPEASLRGAAVVALRGLGHEPPRPEVRSIAHDPALAESFAAARRRQRDLERALFPE